MDVIDWDFDGGITVSGSNFQDGCNLTIDGQTWSSLTPEGGGSLTVDYDPRMISIGIWNVIVTNPDGQASVEDVTLEVTGDETPPDIISITPNHGPKNKEVFPVVIAGTDFVDTPTVLIGNLV